MRLLRDYQTALREPLRPQRADCRITLTARFLLVVVGEFLRLRKQCVQEIGGEQSTFSIGESDNNAVSEQLGGTNATRGSLRHLESDAVNG